MALFMCNTSNVHEMKFGRPQTVLNDVERPNGVIVTLGATKEGQGQARELDHCHAIEEGALTSVAGKFIVVAPEINVQEYRKIDGQIGKFVLEVGETYTAYQLSVLDRLEYSDAYFKDAAALKVGDKVNVQQKDANGARFVKADTGGAMRIVSIVPLWLPVMLAPNIGVGGQQDGQPALLMPQSCQMIKVEVEK